MEGALLTVAAELVVCHEAVLVTFDRRCKCLISRRYSETAGRGFVDVSIHNQKENHAIHFTDDRTQDGGTPRKG